MNYFEIGQRVRRIRKAKSISQEALAERAGISTTHMSHIETGNTKLSLPVFAALAEALEVRADDLLYDAPRENAGAAAGEMAALLDGCTAGQARVIVSLAKAAKQSMDVYLK